jgi:hypothetical protein
MVTFAIVPASVPFHSICFVFLCFFTITMGRVAAEQKSCRKLKGILEFDFCLPCWEQQHLSNSFFINRNLTANGRCHRLYPEKADGFDPLKPDGGYWDDVSWKCHSRANGT